MLAVALDVGYEALLAIINRSHADESTHGVALAIVSLLVLPWLGRRKLRVASLLTSQALRGDGVLTLAAAALAAVTVAALLLNLALGWWWADPAAAVLISVALATEGIRVAVRHRFG